MQLMRVKTMNANTHEYKITLLDPNDTPRPGFDSPNSTRFLLAKLYLLCIERTEGVCMSEVERKMGRIILGFIKVRG